jgi:hypothetical protein
MVVQRRLPHYTGTVNPAPPPRGPRSPHYADPQAARPPLGLNDFTGIWAASGSQSILRARRSGLPSLSTPFFRPWKRNSTP